MSCTLPTKIAVAQSITGIVISRAKTARRYVNASDGNSESSSS
jgi:hypothetical protein